MNRVNPTAVVVVAALLVGCKTAPAHVADEPSAAAEATTQPVDALVAALDDPMRTPEDRARDTFRHPRETLAFFGVEPTDTVVELWSGGGWYTRVLAPYIASTGMLHVTSYPADSEREYFRKMAAGMQAYLSAAPNGAKVRVIPLDAPAPEDAIELGVDGEADVVLTFRNIHNWVKGGYDRKVYEAAFKALKPGGTFGVVEHRGPEGMTREQSATTGYMDQNTVIEDVKAVGFEFVASSEVNANPADTKDHPEGVWTLPPTLRLGDVDRDKWVAIGESDRMTLKFVKPE